MEELFQEENNYQSNSFYSSVSNEDYQISLSNVGNRFALNEEIPCLNQQEELNFSPVNEIQKDLTMTSLLGEINTGANEVNALHSGFPNEAYRNFPLQSHLKETVVVDRKPSSSCSSFTGNPKSSSFFSALPINSITKPRNSPSSELFPHQATMQAYRQNQNFRIPTSQSDDAAITKAMLHVISSSTTLPSPASYGDQDPTQNYHRSGVSLKTGAFLPYDPSLYVKSYSSSSTNKNILKRTFSFLRNLRMRRNEQVQISPPNINQVHHMISERRRREKLNESFQTLRSLLPPGIKKDKVSVLACTIDHLKTLKSQVEELKEKHPNPESCIIPASHRLPLLSENIQVELKIKESEASDSSTEDKEIDIQMTVTVKNCDVVDLISRILTSFKNRKNTTIVSMVAYTKLTSFHQAIFYLRTKANEFEELSFKDSIVDSFAHITPSSS